MGIAFTELELVNIFFFRIHTCHYQLNLVDVKHFRRMRNRIKTYECFHEHKFAMEEHPHFLR